MLRRSCLRHSLFFMNVRKDDLPVCFFHTVSENGAVPSAQGIGRDFPLASPPRWRYNKRTESDGVVNVICGLQKLTLLDFPGRTACTVFLGGCNFRCPFCHNGGLLDGNAPSVMGEEELLAFLNKRRGLLDGVCVTGGEPTLWPELPRLLTAIRELGYQIKLDTNGSRPGVLRGLAEAGLLDYVAMDVKNSPARYGETVGLPNFDVTSVEESLSFLLNGTLDYELRTTVVEELHDEADFEDIGEWLRSLAPGRPARRYFLQPFVDRDTVLSPGLNPPKPERMARFREILEPFVVESDIRGL